MYGEVLSEEGSRSFCWRSCICSLIDSKFQKILNQLSFQHTAYMYIIYYFQIFKIIIEVIGHDYDAFKQCVLVDSLFSIFPKHLLPLNPLIIPSLSSSFMTYLPFYSLPVLTCCLFLSSPCLISNYDALSPTLKCIDIAGQNLQGFCLSEFGSLCLILYYSVPSIVLKFSKFYFPLPLSQSPFCLCCTFIIIHLLMDFQTCFISF